MKDLPVWYPMINGASLIQKGKWLFLVPMITRWISVRDLPVWDPMINGDSLIQKGKWLSRVSMMA